MNLMSLKGVVIHGLLGLTLILFGLAFNFCLPVTLHATAVPAQLLSSKNSKEVQIPTGLSADEVDSYLAGLSDVQVREVLARKMKAEGPKTTLATAAEESEERLIKIETIFYRMEEGASTALKRIFATFSAEETAGSNWSAVINKITHGRGKGFLLLTIFIGLALIAAGMVVERLVLRSTEDFRKQLLASVPLGKLQRVGRFISRLLLDALGVAVYMLTTFVLFILIYDRGDAGHGIVSVSIVVSYYLVIIMLAAKVVLSPTSPALRLLPLKDEDAKFLYRWLFRINIVAAMLAGPSVIFKNAGSEDLFMLFYSGAGFGIIVCLLIMIIQSKQRIAIAICQEAEDSVCVAETLRSRFAKSWHVLAILYVLGSGSYWLINLWTGGGGEIVKLIASLFLIPIFIGLDQWGQRLLKMASGELPEVIDLSGEEKTETVKEPQDDKKKDIKHFAPLIRRALRFVLLILLIFIVLGLWGIKLPFGLIFASRALDIIIALIIGLLIWEFTKARIDRKLKEEMPEDDEEMEEGGAGGSRTGTLLLLLRKFLLVVMFVLVSLMILSSLGIDIGPLIAGAGVIGLAIGFGAQTLVKDIIAGIFFLIDDAFRVGDYIEAAGQKGMVEHISIRSLRLRNPKGMIHTIPFGGMGNVTNFSRDYIITKLDFRVRYDTDVEKVRKIIKKINKAISKDEEMGPVMLGKIKSQGVREMDDSAMIMRVKFKTIPGEQFVVRREVYRQIQESFRENGIEFAHRNVTVYMPPQNIAPPGGQLDPQAMEAGAAAAIAAAQADEEAKKPKEKKA